MIVRLGLVKDFDLIDGGMEGRRDFVRYKLLELEF